MKRTLYLSLEAWQHMGLQLYGDDPNQWEFVCPDCGLVQKGQDFLDMGMGQALVDTILGYSCIRRWQDQSCMSSATGPMILVISHNEPHRPTFEFPKP